MLDFYLTLEAHDKEHKLHYKVDNFFIVDESYMVSAQLNFAIHQVRIAIIEQYKKDMVKNKFHLKVVK